MEMKNIVMIFSCLLETEVRRSEIKALLSINASSLCWQYSSSCWW